MLAFLICKSKSGFFGLDFLQLFECHPAVVIVAAQHACQHEANHVRAAVFTACRRAERYSRR